MKAKKSKKQRNKLALSTLLVLLNAVVFLLLCAYYIFYCCIFASEWAFTEYDAVYFAGMQVLLAFKLLIYQGAIAIGSVIVYYLSAIANHVGERNRLLERSGGFGDRH